jgi:hypothetical protein
MKRESGSSEISLILSGALLLFSLSANASNDKAQANSYDNAWETQWVNHSRQVLSAGSGKTAGFVLQIGDSITHSNPYSQFHYAFKSIQPMAAIRFGENR